MTTTQNSETLSHEDAVAQKQRSNTAAVKTWHHLVKPTADQAVNFVNVAPAQGAGEVVISGRTDGKVDLFYYV